MAETHSRLKNQNPPIKLKAWGKVLKGAEIVWFSPLSLNSNTEARNAKQIKNNQILNDQNGDRVIDTQWPGS